MKTSITLFIICLVCISSFAQKNVNDYWNNKLKITAYRLPPPPIDYTPKLVDLTGDGKPDAIFSITRDSIPILWIDDDGDMTWEDLEGDTKNDCLLIDRNRDGIYGGQGDFIVDWVDSDNDGKADLQIIVEYPEVRTGEVWPNGHYMIVMDVDRDDIFNYINWNNMRIDSWAKSGISDFLPDYSGQSAFMKIHTSTYDIKDLRLNWENPFLFYDEDGDGLSEMAIRLLDSPDVKDRSQPSNSYVNRQLEGETDWVSVAIDMDNDNAPGNEFDFDMTIGFQGKGFNYMDQVHKINNLRGLPKADTFFMDARWRQLTELIYPDHAAAWDLIFKRGEWNRVNFVFDEDDDCNRWERVEFYDPRDPFKVGWNAGGIDNNKQSDAAGDRGEWDMDNSGGGKLYVSRFDGRLHLYGAEWGCWRIDQNTEYYQGWDRMWMGQDRYPKNFATVKYSDKDNNGFFETVEYDMDGDFEFETTIDLKASGIDDRCELIDISQFKYKDFTDLMSRMSEEMWNSAQEALQIAEQYKLNTAWYAKWKQASSVREKYHKGYWLQYYIYKDLENLFLRKGDKKLLEQLTKAYYSGDWNVIDEKTVQLQSGETYFFSPQDIQNIRLSAKTEWGKIIVDSLKIQVAERRKHSLVVPVQEAGHIHSFFCPVHNVYFDFDWESPDKHYCRYCDKYYSNERNNWAWVAELHNRNLAYLVACSYLYIANNDLKYAGYIKEMLLDYAGKYPDYKIHDKGMGTTDPTCAKLYAQSLDEAVWFSDACRAYSVIKPVLKKDEIEKIEMQLFREAANLLLTKGGGGNWQVWNNSGLAALGVVLNDDAVIKTAIEDTKAGYRTMMKNHVNRDGWWNENSPNYHFFPFRAMLLTADAVRCKGYNLYDEQLESMFLGPIYGAYSDMMLPSHNDGWYGVTLLDYVKLYETGYVRYKNPVFLKTLQACYGIQNRLEPEALLTNVAIKNSGEQFDLNSYVLGQTGFGILRDGNKSVVLKYGPSGGGHGHPDKLSLSIHNGQSEIVSDLGTSAYGVPDYLNWYKKTLSHNTVTVDFKDQKPATGELIVAGPNALEAFTTKTYPGVEMRRAVSFEENVLNDKFTCTSDSVHTYEYVLILNEAPQIEGLFQSAELNESVAHQQIKHVKRAIFDKPFVLKTSTATIRFTVDSATPFEVFVGEASGIPPTNPSIKTITGSEKRPVQSCYPLIIRTKGENMKIGAVWELR
ncbi:MAG: heparinase II/III family protein [Dysgonamonadaceae bacterium]|jgi:hypothetical protein|nr:heparinase II/III family protein [Dysgonamonadaceae bacterium]